MAEIADEYSNDAGLQAAQWKLFDEIALAGGSIAPGDYESFGFNRPQTMRFGLQRLEQANILDSTIDETDTYRDVPGLIRAGQVTNSGALIGLLHVLALG